MSYTVESRNGALGTTRHAGTYDTQELAEAYAKARAEASQSFVQFQACEGTPKMPGELVGPTYQGGRHE